MLTVRTRIWLPVLVVSMIVPSITASAKVRVRFAHWDTNPFIQTVVKSFNASQKKYEVTYEVADSSKLLVSLAGGSAPAVFTAGWFGALGMMMDKGMLMELSPLTNRDKAEMHLDDFSKPLLEAGKHKGKSYGLPFEDIGTNCVWYNSDLYQSAGLSTPSDNWTVQDAIANAIKLTKDNNGDGKLDQAGFIPLDGWYEARIAAMVLGGGGLFYSDDRTKWIGDSPANVKAMKLIETLINKNRVTAAGTAFSGWTDFFGRGKTGMWIRDACLTALVTTTGSKWHFNIAPPPALDGTGARAPQDAQGTYIVIPKGTKKAVAEGAWAFMKYWTSEAGAKAMWDSQGWIQRPLPRASLSAKYFLHPKDKRYSSVKLENFLKYKDVVSCSENWPYKKFDRSNQLLQEGWSKVAAGKTTVERFLADVTPVMKRLLSQN